MRRAFTYLAAVGGLLAAHAASAQKFTAPVQLSRNGYASDATAGIDAAGKAVAFWLDLGVFASDRAQGGRWSHPATLDGSVLPGTSPALRVDAAGRTSLLSWTSGIGIWVADRPANAAWGSAAQVASAPTIVLPTKTDVPTVQFLSNPRGDQALIYVDAVGSSYRLIAIRRGAGSGWGAPEVVVTSTSSTLLTQAAAAIGPSGDVLAVWESFAVRCGTRSCSDYNFVVHAVRAQANSAIWAQSADLTLPSLDADWTLAAIDAAGRAVVLIEPRFGDTVLASTQPRAGAGWTVPSAAFSAPGTLVFPWSLNTSPSGGATAVLTSATSGATAVVAVEGNVSANTWAAGVNVATADPSGDGAIVSAANALGGAVIAWTDRDGTERAVLRRSATSPWQAPQQLAGPGQCMVLNLNCTTSSAAAIDSRGHAVVLYNRAEPSDSIHTLYAATE